MSLCYNKVKKRVYMLNDLNYENESLPRHSNTSVFYMRYHYVRNSLGFRNKDANPV